MKQKEKDGNYKNKGFSKDDAYQTLNLVNSWTGNIDTKTSFVLALEGILIGVMFRDGTPRPFRRIAEVSGLAELSVLDVIAFVAVSALSITSFFSVFYFLRVIKARVQNPNQAESMFFFKTIAGIGLEEYTDQLKRIDNQGLIEDLEEQIHTNAGICSQKVAWYNKGIDFLRIAVSLLYVCIIFGYV